MNTLRSEAQHHADILARRRKAAPICAASIDLVRSALETRLPEPAREHLEFALISLDALLQDGGEISEPAAMQLVEFVSSVTA